MSLTANQKALAVFDQLQLLANFKGRQSEFNTLYLEVCARLCRSPLATLCGLESDQLKLSDLWQDQQSSVLSQQAVQALLAQCGQLLYLLGDNPYKFEPCGVTIDGFDEPFLLVFVLECEPDEAPSYVFVVTEHADIPRFNDVVVRAQLLKRYYRFYDQNQQTPEPRALNEQQALYALELIDAVVHRDQFGAAALRLVDEIAGQFDCEQVSLGVKSERYAKLAAISHVEKFDKNSAASTQLEQLFEEALDQDRRVQAPEASAQVINRSHQQALANYELSHCISIPVGDDEFSLCINLQKRQGQFSERDLLVLNVVLLQLLSWLKYLYFKQLKPVSKAKYQLQRFANWCFGPNASVIKLAAVACSVFILALLLVKKPYEIEATAHLETDNVAFLAAPFTSYVDKINASAGDKVEQDQPLLALDIEELRLSSLEQSANIARFSREAEKHRSERRLVDMRVAIAKQQQAQAEYQRLEFYLGQAQMLAPFDGIIVEGEKSELLGSPVNKGDVLIKIASSGGLYIKAKISEKDIDHFSLGSQAQLKLLSHPHQTYPLRVTQLVPMAQTDAKGGNVFVVKADYVGDTLPNWWQPGMSGVVHIDSEPKSLMWILLHRTIDTLRMRLWL